MSNLTPMMKQYMEIKSRHKDAILFFRLGDFYEMFFDDAILASKELEIALTGRDCGQREKAPMCGIPYHSSDSYIAKLIKKGYKVAICEQVEDPAKSKGIVKRDVVRIITPGTITDAKVLDEKRNNYLSCIYMDKDGFGISYSDITTGDLYTTEIANNNTNIENKLLDELAKIQPTEIIVNSFLYENEKLIKKIKDRFNLVLNTYHDWAFEISHCKNKILNHFNVLTLEGFGIENKKYSTSSLGGLLEYLTETQKIVLSHLNTVRYYSMDKYMVLDINTRRNLELTETMRDKSKKGSLLWLLDKTSTAMGARLLKKWIEEPLLDRTKIIERLNAVKFLYNNKDTVDSLKDLLKSIYDMERLMGRISYGNCNGRDLISLKDSIKVIPDIKDILISADTKLLVKLGNEIDELMDVYNLIEDSIIDEPPLTIKEGGIIKPQYDETLKELKEASAKGKEWLSSLEENEKLRTGIKSLKVGYNKVFGYYIEVTKTNIKNVPDNYMRKQTLANSERYITPELKDMESKILGAEEKSMNIEYQIFMEIRDRIRNEVKRIQFCAHIISCIDCLLSLAIIAFNNNYIMPTLNTEGIIDIQSGRHPVVEKMIDQELFVPNNTFLDNKNRIIIITGPNMAGKSTYMRQVALITLMAQIGSFVPAESANIGIVDKIFTRVGASDDLAQGQSTFMVEMSEVANILNNSTKNSLVILDEIGRGTSTFDGLSIAWSVVEYISNKDKIGAKTLFATHYHELTELEGEIDGVKNYKILVKEKGEDIIFLRKISRGGADKSYGIEVARLAGVPKEVIDRAKIILKSLEEKNITKKGKLSDIVPKEKNSKHNDEEMQLDLFNAKEKEIIDKIKNVDIMDTTPMDAMNLLYSLIKKVKDL